MRFKKPKINFNDAEANNRLSKSFGMYDISTPIVIAGESHGNAADVSSKPKVFSASYGKWFVVGAGCEINVFDLAVSVEHKFHILLKDTDRIVNLVFLPDDNLFLVVLFSGVIVVCAPDVVKDNSPLMKQELLLPEIANCSIAIVNEAEKYMICILELKGSAHFLEMKKFNTIVKRELDTIDPMRLTFSSEKIDCQHVIWALNRFVFFPQRKSERLKFSAIHCGGASNAAFWDAAQLRDDICAVRNVGELIVALTNDNRFVFFDLDLIELHTMRLTFADNAEEDTRRAIDFEFLDIDAFCGLKSKADVRVLFTLKEDGRETEFALKSLVGAGTLFDAPCANDVTLIPHATRGDDSSIIFVEAYSQFEPNSIVVRFINEAQPTLRLKRLLDNGRFTEALEFAKMHDLSLDIVYIALIRKCQDQILSEEGYDESVFEELMKYLALLSKHDEACDFCVAALSGVNKYTHMVKILEFTQKKKIKDASVIADIAHFRYELGSYRMLYGASNSSYDRDSVWPVFFTLQNHMSLFEEFCQAGKIIEARIIFVRYSDEAHAYFSNSDAMKRLLGFFKSSIIENPATNVPIAEFIESDLMAFFLLGAEKNIPNAHTFFEFIIDMAKHLECIQPKEFPENSLHFAQSFSRGLESFKEKCFTANQQVKPILTLNKLNVDSYDESFPCGRLNVLVRNLKNLVRIYRVYQCPMSYNEFLHSDVNSICSSILDRVRTAQSIRDHIESFVFPYMIEHNLDKNEMLYGYIKKIASMLHRGSAQYSNSWDQLCLQIAESIADADLRCKAVVEIAAGSIPPWSEQLTAVVRNTLTHTDDVDPALIHQLREECRRAELGQIFVAYHIPLTFRASEMSVVSLSGLLQFIFRNSDKDPAVRLNDAFKILSIYESLGRVTLTRIECYRLYAVSIVMQLRDEYDLSKLIFFFQLIKSPEERSEVAWKLVYYIKCLVRETTIRKLQMQRLVWLSSLLCVIERFISTKTNSEAIEIAQRARNIRKLQVEHELIIGFETLADERKCVERLEKFVSETSTKRTLEEVVVFGRLFSLSLRRIFDTVVQLQINPEESIATLQVYVEQQTKPELVDLDSCFGVCATALWNISQLAIDTGMEFKSLRYVVQIFRAVLPTLLDWSMNFESLTHIEKFSSISTYIRLLEHILDLCVIDKVESIERGDETKTPDESDLFKKVDKIYTNRRRVGTFLPLAEGSFFDHNTVLRNAAAVASSIVVEFSDDDNGQNDEFIEYWHRLFDSLSSHKVLEIFARQFSETLPCFTNVRLVNGPTMSLRQCVSELCQKILSVPIADLSLAAHLLLRLESQDLKRVLQDLRRWVSNNRKSVRISLNIIRLSLFVLIESNDYANVLQQLGNLFEATLWQKRFSKFGVIVSSMSSLQKEAALDLVGDFVKVLVSPTVLKRFCLEMKVPNRILLNYAIELCKISSGFIKDRERFFQTISTAKAALREVTVDDEAVHEVINVIQTLCPYNYEVLELLLKQLEEWCAHRPEYEIWIKDRLLLLAFLTAVKRKNGYTEDEMRWYRTRSSNRNGSDATSHHSDDMSLMDEESQSAVTNSVSALLSGLYRKQEVYETNFPASSSDRLPFHLFLSFEAKDKLSLTIIQHELSIYTVLRWTTLIEETKEILNQSRTALIVTAITNYVSDAIKYKRELRQADLQQIRMLVMRDLDRRLIIVKSLGQRFRKLQLCDIKIAVFKICYEIADDSASELSAADERRSCIEYRDALKRTLAQSITDLLLSKNNLLNANTSALSSEPIPLISYICSNCIDWNDNLNIEKHFRVVEAIAKVNEVRLDEVYDQLILGWLPGSENVEVGNTQHADPDATIDFMGTNAGALLAAAPTSINDELPLPVLYGDPSLSKIVFLLKKCDPETKARTIYQKFQQEAMQTPASYLTKIRSACCLIRYLTDDQMREILSMSNDEFCSQLIQLINNRLLSVSRVGIGFSDYSTTDKTEFVRSILSPQSFRQTPEIAHLISCVIVDNNIRDMALIDKAAYRLMQLRMMRPLMALLDYTRSFNEAKTVANIATYYARLFEWNFDKIRDFDNPEDENDCNRKKLSLVYFIIGCPVEGGANFSRPKTLLSMMPCSAALVSIASLSTEKVESLTFDSSMIGKDIVLSREFI